MLWIFLFLELCLLVSCLSIFASAAEYHCCDLLISVFSCFVSVSDIPGFLPGTLSEGGGGGGGG